MAGVSTAVLSEEPLGTSPNQYMGVEADPPAFDTSDLGNNLSFATRLDTLIPLDPGVVARAVYLGTDDFDEPYYIWESGFENFWALLTNILTLGGVEIDFESSYGTKRASDSISGASGFTHWSVMANGDQEQLIVAEWHALPPEASVVALSRDGSGIAWQRPVSGTAAMHLSIEMLDESNGPLVLTVFDSTGAAIDSDSFSQEPGT